MEREKFLKSVKARLKYMDLVGGLPSCSVKTIDQLLSTLHEDADTIFQFCGASEDSHEELQRLLIEMCANVIRMSTLFDKKKERTLFDALNEGEFKFPTIMQDPPYNQGGPVFPQRYGPGGPVAGGPVNVTSEGFKKFNDAIRGIANLPPRVGKVSDGELRKDEYKKLTFSEKVLVEQLSKKDPACINGLTRIIVDFNRGDIVRSMLDMDLVGRPYCLGFMAKLCQYNIKKMDAVIKAWKNKSISADAVREESLDHKGKRFNISYLMDHM